MPTQGLYNIGGFNLPDFGISEGLSALTGGDQQGGLLGGLVKNNAAVYPGANSNALTYGSPSTSNNGFIGPQKPANLTDTSSAGSQQGVLGTATNNNPNLTLNDFLNQQQAAQNAAYNAENSKLNTQYDQNAANVQNQLGFLGTQRDNALGSLNTDFTNTQNTVGGQRSDAQQNADDQISQAGSVAHSTQAQNRNVLRSLGILNSSAAGELLTKPINEFDNQRAAVNTQLGQRFRDLDNFMNDQVSKHSDAIKQIQDNYGNLVGNIQSDLRFNDRQRNDAIQAANAALQQHIADIQGSVLNYANQVNQQKQQLALGMAQIMSYRNPNFDPSGILNSAINSGQSTLGSFIDPTQQKKQQNTLSGL